MKNKMYIPYKRMNAIKLLLMFVTGYIYFMMKNQTSHSAYRAMRELFVRTNGRLNNIMSLFLSLRYPIKDVEIKDSILGDISDKKTDAIISQLKDSGFYKFDARLEEKEIEKILYLARNTPAKIVIPQKSGSNLKIEHSDEFYLFNSQSPLSPRYFFGMDQIIEFEPLHKILFDAGILKIAQKYLNCEPVLDLFAMWWSAPFMNGQATAESAQEYHFDMDRLKFLKFFFYLTDVNLVNGPHCYVERSHRRLKKEFRNDRRFTDEEVFEHYTKANIHHIVGKKGTIIVADTRGLHKGEPLRNGERLIFQIEFSNSLFGQSYPKFDSGHMPNFCRDIIDKHPHAYQIFKSKL